MNLEIKYPLAMAVVYLWIGFVCAISFMEAWLKFRAPGLTLPVGLGIGRLVFNALNKIEWVFVIMILFSFLINGQSFFTWDKIAFYIPFIVLVLQTVWMLPVLDARAEIYINGESAPLSNMHFYYVAAEVIKTVSLFMFSLKLVGN